jgi:hypothetical protein
MRILEISEDDFFRRNRPAGEVDFFYTGGSPRKFETDRLTAATFQQLRGKIRDGHYDLVACSPISLPAWRADRSFLRNLGGLLGRVPSRFHSFGVTLLPWLLGRSRVPVLAYNRKDSPVMPRQNFELLRLCTRYFIRELPQNNWNLFLLSTAKNEDVVNIVRQPLFQQNVGKIRPISLGFDRTLDDVLPLSANKTSDIFYAGKNHSTTVRTKGLLQLARLRELGFRVDLPETTLDRAEFLRRCAAAHLVWSPEGLGWDCHRHYESLLAGSVPMINYPTIERYQPLEDGRHCLFYPIEGDGLVEAAKAALADKLRLEAISREGREHILRWHRHDLLAQYMITETLAGLAPTNARV